MTVPFTVIIPTYNRLELLKAALDSVWQQTFTDYEVIVVDDDSTDGTWDWLQSLRPRVRAFRQRHLGPSAARNLAASHGVGEYLAFLDSDDLWFPSTLDTYANALQQHGEVTLLCASWIEFSGTPPFLPAAHEPIRARRYRDYLEAGSEGAVYVGAGLMATRRDLFLKSGGFDYRLDCAEDHDLALRLGESPGCVVLDAPYQVAYRRHDASATQNLEKTLHGVRAILERERSGAYPGGLNRRTSRRTIIARTVRPVSLACLREFRCQDAWRLYLDLLPWTLSGAQWKYLMGFPWVAFSSMWTSDPRG